MSNPANTPIHVEIPSEICREETCERLDVHVTGAAACVKRRGRESLYRTRSRKHALEPWRAYCHEALHASVLLATSTVEPRNFATILSIVENDYGSCCDRSVHRHLSMLKAAGEIVRMDFKGRIHAYLRAGSKLVNDPDLVLEQIIDLHVGLEDVRATAQRERGVATISSVRTWASRTASVMPTSEDFAEIAA